MSELVSNEISIAEPAEPDMAAIAGLLVEIRDAMERPSLNDCIAADAPKLAKLLSISERSVWSLKSAGKLPKPIKLAGRTVWYLETVRQFLAEKSAQAAKQKS